MQTFSANTLRTLCSFGFFEMEHRLQSSNMPRVYRASQPAICLEDETGTLPCYKTQLGDSTAVEEELFPNNKGYVRVCVVGREGSCISKEDSEDVSR